MSRILITLSTISLLIMVVAIYLGLSIDDLYATPSESTLRAATMHRLTGTAAALAVVFVESIVVTYFIGTSRWCKEVVETYRLDAALMDASARLKGHSFPWAVSGMLVVIAVGALGAAGDPGTGRPDTQWWAGVHLAAALGGVAFVAWTYLSLWQKVHANQKIIDQIVAEVARIRSQRGYDRDTSLPVPSNAKPVANVAGDK